MESKSLALAKELLRKKVRIKIDRQLGTKHPKWDFVYDVNYGYIEGIIAPDGEELDAYLLKVDKPVEEFEGVVVAIVHRTDNDDDKLVVVPEGEGVSDEEIDQPHSFKRNFSNTRS